MKIKPFILCSFFLIGAQGFSYDEYHNPVDRKTNITDEWKTAYPEKPAPKKAQRVEGTDIRLLTPENEIAKNISVETLVSFIKEMGSRANSLFADSTSDGEILLQVTLQPKPKKPAMYQMAFQGNIKQDELQKFYDILEKINPPEVKISEVSFQVHYIVHKV